MSKVDRIKGVWIILAIGFVLGLALTVFLYFDSTTVTKTKWDKEITDSTDYEISVNIGERIGIVTYITGYFFKYGESITFCKPELKLVRDDGVCFEVPTVSVIDETIDEKFVDEYEYKSGGFEAVVNYTKVEPGTYTIYIYDREKDVTLDSQVRLEVTNE